MLDAKPYAKVAVIGGGAWGTALANLSARNGAQTVLWARESGVVESVNAAHENAMFLPGVALDCAMRATASVGDAAATAEAIVFAAPAQFARAVLRELRAVAPAASPLALCSKGIEQTSGLLLTEVLQSVWPAARAAVLSGPSFAKDVARGLPTAVTLASADAELGARWLATMSSPHFRPYLSDDLIGAELGGAVKNVLAIAAGAVIGKGLGESARAAIIARGFAEFQRLGSALGAKRETMAGLSGLGDLILTASSMQSRNFSLGAELGRGASLQSILDQRNSVAEGVATAPAVVARARAADVEMPVCEAVADLVSGAKPLDAIVAELLARPLKTEAG